MRKEFLKDAPKQEHKVVDAFVASNAETMLKTKPKVSKSFFYAHSSTILGLLSPVRDFSIH